ncbi:hypothetical protein K5V21_12700 [Clostridium sardiniense]|uniref:Uncharacterized protein n=1 Tax=Clostridium sardiniense TaxID=29369 RepID=A0ABS7L0C9_CLOSR|nr:hypothetical protein [Clostridium sardiniense]MBY0756307.1 hypothetical protein [Clostridium sardiniense]MDQ0461462.1 hypothetical protein [Clostridium sardiniense]
MERVLILAGITFILREVVCIFEFRRYLAICSIKEKYSDREERILLNELERIIDNYRGMLVSEGEYNKNFDIIDKLNLRINLNYEELEYIKNMWLKTNLGFPLLTRTELKIFEILNEKLKFHMR